MALSHLLQGEGLALLLGYAYADLSGALCLIALRCLSSLRLFLTVEQPFLFIVAASSPDVPFGITGP